MSDRLSRAEWAEEGRAEREEAGREVADAIRLSHEEDRTVTLPWSRAAETELLALSDDSADTEGEQEYWGEDDGGRWRVHLRREGGA